MTAFAVGPSVIGMFGAVGRQP
jgi:hypothetical protein